MTFPFQIELIDEREPASRYLSYSGIKNSLIGASHQQRMVCMKGISGFCTF